MSSRGKLAAHAPRLARLRATTAAQTRRRHAWAYFRKLEDKYDRACRGAVRSGRIPPLDGRYSPANCGIRLSWLHLLSWNRHVPL